jgi:hypothetical protein
LSLLVLDSGKNGEVIIVFGELSIELFLLLERLNLFVQGCYFFVKLAKHLIEVVPKVFLAVFSIPIASHVGTNGFFDAENFIGEKIQVIDISLIELVSLAGSYEDWLCFH